MWPSLNKAAVSQLRQGFKVKLVQTPVILKQSTEKTKKQFLNKLTNLNKSYEKIIGLRDLKLSLQKVSNLQEDLRVAQEQRRKLGKQLDEVRDKSNEIEEQLHKVKRLENAELFLSLLKEQTKIIKLEKEIHKSFQQTDQKERDISAEHANAIRDSYEKQRVQQEYTKYFRVVMSIVASTLAFFYSTLKKDDLKAFIESNVHTVAKNSEDLKVYLENSSKSANITQPVVTSLIWLKDKAGHALSGTWKALKYLPSCSWHVLSKYLPSTSWASSSWNAVSKYLPSSSWASSCWNSVSKYLPSSSWVSSPWNAISKYFGKNK